MGSSLYQVVSKISRTLAHSNIACSQLLKASTLTYCLVQQLQNIRERVKSVALRLVYCIFSDKVPRKEDRAVAVIFMSGKVVCRN